MLAGHSAAAGALADVSSAHRSGWGQDAVVRVNRGASSLRLQLALTESNLPTRMTASSSMGFAAQLVAGFVTCGLVGLLRQLVS